MPDSHVRFSEYARQLIQEGSKRAGRGAMAIVLAASMTGAMVPAQAFAQESTPTEVATSVEAKNTPDSGKAAASTVSGQKSDSTASQQKEDVTEKKSSSAVTESKGAATTGSQQTTALSAKLNLQVATSKTTSSTAPSTTSDVSAKKAAASTSDTAPSFDASSVVYNSGDAKLTIDGREAGTFAVFQVAGSWTAGTPVQGADGRWRATLTIVPKAENRIPGHFGDSGYELDSSASKLTLTYVYVPTTGKWITDTFSDRATVAYKKAAQAPAFDIAKQSVGVVVYAAGEWDPAYEGTVQIPSGMVQSVSKPYQKDGRWFVDVELKQGTPKDYGVGDKTSDGVYLFDDANSVTTFSFATDSLDGTTWTAMPTEDGDPKVAFYQVAAPDADAIVNAKVTVKTTDGTKEGSYYLGAGTYEVGPVIMGYAGPVCVVTLKSDQQQSYVDEFNADQANDDTYELSVAKPSDLQFYFSYDPETQEWTNTTSDQYIYVKKAPEKAPAFDAAAVVENDAAVTAQIKLADGTTVDAKAASIKDVAASYQASDPVQDKDGNWTATLTIVPKAFADYPGLAALVKDNAAKGSTFELDSESSNLTLTYRYSKDSGTWAADGQATVVFQEKAATPAEPQNPQDPTKPTTPAAPTTDPSTNNSNTNNSSTKTTNAAGTSNNSPAKKNVPAQTSTAKKATANSSSLPKTGDTSNAAGAATAGIIGIASVVLSAVSSLLQKRRNEE